MRLFFMGARFPSSVAVVLPLLIALVYAHNAARYASQSLNGRSAYVGGWALAQAGTGSTCPANVSVACNPPDSVYNLACCPNGQKCTTTAEGGQYCCPTSSDCYTAVVNFPSCANTSWIMFEYESEVYFCCEPGKLALKPLTDVGGICVPADQVAPTSLLATIIPQIGAAATSTATSSSPHTALPTGRLHNPTASSSSSSSASSSSASSSSTGSSSSMPISTNTIIIIGVVAGGVIIFGTIIGCFIRGRLPKARIEKDRDLSAGPGSLFQGSSDNYRPIVKPLDQPPPYSGAAADVWQYQRAEMQEQRSHDGRAEIPTGYESHELA